MAFRDSRVIYIGSYRAEKKKSQIYGHVKRAIKTWCGWEFPDAFPTAF